MMFLSHDNQRVIIKLMVDCGEAQDSTEFAKIEPVVIYQLTLVK